MRNFITLIIISFSFFKITYSQVTFEELNHIYNSSFELKNVSSGPSVGSNNAEVYKLKSWTSRTLVEPEYGTIVGNCCYHSPDWIYGGSGTYSTFTGLSEIGMAPYEMIMQDFKGDLPPDRKMLFTAYVDVTSAPSNFNYPFNFDLLFSKGEMKYKWESDEIYSNGDPVEFDQCTDDYRAVKNVSAKRTMSIIGADAVAVADYFPITNEFSYTKPIFKSMALNLSLGEDAVCDYPYVRVDDVSIIPASCNECPVARFLQNETFTASIEPQIIKAQEHIVVGSNIIPPINGIDNFGNVNVLNNSNVSFQAATSITMKPGFYVENGATYETLYQPCVIEHGVDDLSASAVDALTDGSGSGNQTDFVIFTNATDYHVRIYNRWGEMVVNESEQLSYSDTAVRIPYGTGSWEMSDCYAEVFTWQAVLSNCKESKLYSGNITVFGPCAFNSNKTVDDINEIEDVNFNIFPNPAQEFIKIESTIDNNKYNYIVYDMVGNVLVEDDIDTELKEVDISLLAKGSYFILILNETQILKRTKFIKI